MKCGEKELLEMMGTKESWLQEKRVRQKSKLLLWFRNDVTKYSLSFIGSVEIFILVPS